MRCLLPKQELLMSSMIRLAKTFGLTGFLIVLAGCATAPQTKGLLESENTSIPPHSIIADLPFFPQDAYQCGPAALATVLAHAGTSVSPAMLVDSIYIPGRKGSLQIEVAAAGRGHNKVSHEIEGSMDTLLREVNSGNPVLVLQNLGLTSFPQWHFAVVKGFDLESKILILNSGEFENYELPLSVFERTWARAQYWAITVLPPDQIPATAEPGAYLPSLWDFEQTTPDSDSVAVAYGAAVDRWPDDAFLHMALANWQLNAGLHDEAVQSYNRVLQLEPEYAPAHNNIAYAYQAAGIVEKAIHHARKAVQFGRNNNAVYQSTLNEIVAEASDV